MSERRRQPHRPRAATQAKRAAAVANILPEHRVGDSDMRHFTHAADLSQRLGVRVRAVAAALARLRIGPAFDRDGRRVVLNVMAPSIAAVVRGTITTTAAIVAAAHSPRGSSAA